MSEQNVSRITTIHLIGFQTNQRMRCLIFFLLLLMYCVIIFVNFLVILIVFSSKTLHVPMYFFLSQLAVTDILLATNILPNTLHGLLVKEPIISFSGCIIQFCCYIVADAVEYFLITVMSYDRYLAICKPLHYTSIMNHHFCWIMISICWTLSIVITLFHVMLITMLQFCGPNVIDHFFCDLDPILQLSCSDTTIIQQEMKCFGAFVLVTPFLVIVLSYIYIIHTIFQISSLAGRQKTFSTCTSHLSVVCTFFSTLLCVYYVPNMGQSTNRTKFLPLLYTAGTPLMNPIIYSLRNKDLKLIFKSKLISLHFNRE